MHVYGKMLTDFVLINDICFGALFCGAFNKVQDSSLKNLTPFSEFLEKITSQLFKTLSSS